ncbi:MAG TPA: DUF805 domain-containing protein [Burkholderiaceae bacterium]
MTFQDAVKICFNKFADFNGRASKPEFWWFFLFSFGGNLILSQFSSVLGFLFSLAVLVPSLAVGARRLHDTDKSGWLQLLHLIVFVGTLGLIYLWLQDPKEPNRYGTSVEPVTTL